MHRTTVLRAALLGAAMLITCLGCHAAHATEFGVYEGAGCTGADNLTAYERWSHRAPDLVLDFVAFGSWQEVESESGWAIGCWKSHGHPALVLSLPLTVKGTELADVAAGKVDASFDHVGRTLVSAGYGAAVLRIGWEMNGGWYPWGNLNDSDPAVQAGRIATYKAAFAHVVRTLRAVPNSHFRIDWCPASGSLQVPQPNLYPGDDVVDIVGTDIYASIWGVDHPSAAQVTHFMNSGWGLDAVAQFGRAHGKPISFPEWGVGDRPQGSDDYGPGDSPEVMRAMLAWFSAHLSAPGRPAGPGEIAYLSYWDYDAGDYNSKVSTGERPNEAAVLQSAIAQDRWHAR